MKRFLVIEADTDRHYLYTYEVSCDYKNGLVNYHREPGDRPGVLSLPREGSWLLDALLPEARPVEPKPANIQAEPPDEAPKAPSAADLDQVAEEESARAETLGVLAKGIAQTRSEILTDSDIPF